MEIGCSSIILIRRTISRINPKKDAVTQWHTQAGNITTNLKVNIYMTLPGINATKNVTLNFHVDDSAKVIYNMILGRYILTALVLNLKYSEDGIETDDRSLKLSSAPMVDWMCMKSKFKYRENYTQIIVYE